MHDVAKQFWIQMLKCGGNKQLFVTRIKYFKSKDWNLNNRNTRWFEMSFKVFNLHSSNFQLNPGFLCIRGFASDCQLWIQPLSFSNIRLDIKACEYKKMELKKRLSAHEVKNFLCLFLRPLKMMKNGVFHFGIPSFVPEISKFFVQKMMT